MSHLGIIMSHVTTAGHTGWESMSSSGKKKIIGNLLLKLFLNFDGQHHFLINHQLDLPEVLFNSRGGKKKVVLR